MAKKEKGQLQSILDKINKTFGDNTIMKLGTVPSATENIMSTGSLMIDKILGGGVPRGRIIEVYGLESSGKSSLALQLVAECQKNGETVAYIDAEQAISPAYSKQLGVNINDLIFSQPNSGEQALEVVDTLAKSGEVSLIIVDSVAALTPTCILQGEMGDASIGALARLLSKGLSKLILAANENNCTILFINQIRQKINTGFMMGETTTTTGGNSLKFYASQRIELKKTTSIKDGDEVVGYNAKITVKKNKIAPPLKTCIIPFMFGKGFGGSDEVLNLAIDYGFIEKAGAWFTTHDGQRLQGRANVAAYYEENKKALDDLTNKVKDKLAGVELEEEIEVNPETGEVLN